MVQETLLVGYQRFGDFRGQTPKELLGWLRQILLNICPNTGRSFSTQFRNIEYVVALEATVAGLPVGATHLADGDSPSGHTSNGERSKAILHAIVSLPKDGQLVIRLRAWNGHTFAEIGKQLDRSPEAVRKLWARGVEQFVKVIRETYGSDGSTAQPR